MSPVGAEQTPPMTADAHAVQPHDDADALTALPLGLAFWLGRRPATKRYTYGYGRAEDLAGVVIVLLIAASSALAAYEAVTRLVSHKHVGHLWAVAVAAVLGFVG